MLPVRSPVPALCSADVKFEACCPGGETEVDCRVAMSIGAAPVIVRVYRQRKSTAKEWNRRRKENSECRARDLVLVRSISESWETWSLSSLREEHARPEGLVGAG